MGSEQVTSAQNQTKPNSKLKFIPYKINLNSDFNSNNKDEIKNSSPASSFTTSTKTAEQETTTSPDSQIPCTFEWKEDGEEVLLTGTFTSWENHIMMKKNPITNIFEQMICLPKGIYQFKFIVDGYWRFSSFYPVTTDKDGNVNNVLNLIKNDNIKFNHIGTQKREKASNKKKEKHVDIFNSVVPQRGELNSDAPRIIFLYSLLFNVNNNTKQNKIGKSKYLRCKEKNLLSENNSSKKIMRFPHGYL